MQPNHTICLRNQNISQMGYFGSFSAFFLQNTEMLPKHTICLRNSNMSRIGCFGVFQRFMHQN
ncbi:hypothetical protein E2C01_059440 [Portunus trituberculatus]|uniref:Uncharacterized protein n=1 Tax=Portunus trituberculatus TaxID=210409 RepID=A0A5B7H7K0_PORTR|nr:hypothetical protein [Portunus trituberculatus]